MKKIKILNRWTYISLTLVIIQQIIVALSTISIILLMKSITEHKEYGIWLFLFFISLILPMIPGSLSILAITKSSIFSFEDYIKLFTSNEHQIDPGSHSDLESIFSSSSEQIITDFLETLRHSTALILNFLFNLIVISFLISKTFLIAYFIGASFAFLFTFKMSEKVSLTSQIEAENKIHMGNFLISGPDNLILGSAINKKIWFDEFLNVLSRYKKSLMSSESIKEFVPIISSIISAIPIFIAIILVVYHHRSNFSYLAVLVSTLPRQILIIQSFYSIVSIMTLFFHSKTRLGILYNSLHKPYNFLGDVSVRVIFDNVEKKICGYDDVCNATKNFSSGRFTIRGDNGSGKSTLLMEIKRRNRTAHYLPVSSRLLFSFDQKNNFIPLSTGERVKNILEEFYETPGQIYLLDEWDANLDEKNIGICNNIIDKISKRSCVIEVRHRQ